MTGSLRGRCFFYLAISKKKEVVSMHDSSITTGAVTPLLQMK